MNVIVVSETLSKLDWRQRVSPNFTTQDLLTALGNDLGIAKGHCVLIHKGSPLGDQPLKQLVSGANKTLRLKASFDHTVAICIWQSLPGWMEDCVVAFWQASAISISEQSAWTALKLADAYIFHDFYSMPATATAPAGLDLARHELTSAEWSAVSPSVRPLLLLVHAFLRMTGLHQAGKDEVACHTQICKHMKAQYRLFQEGPLPISNQSNKYLRCLRAVVLMLQLSRVLSTIKISDAVLDLMHMTLNSAAVSTSQEAARIAENPLPTAVHGEAQALCDLAIKMALPLLRRRLKMRTAVLATESHDWICQLLSYLVPSHASGIFNEVAHGALDAGAIPVLVVALDANAAASTFRSTAEAAFSVLQKLLAKEDAPAEVWEATEVALLRMQAVPRLCKFLEPEGADWSVEIEAKLNKQKQDWIKLHGPEQLPQMFMAAHAINRLLKRNPPPSDPAQALPTPSPAAWEALVATFDLLLKAQAFYTIPDSMIAELLDPVAGFRALWALQHLRLSVEEMPFYLMAGHLPNMALDVVPLMRQSLQRLMAMPEHIAKGEEAPTKLMLAVFRRLSWEPSILALTSVEIAYQRQGVPKHKMPCHGCSACKTPMWHFKTLVVPNLLCMCCTFASLNKDPSPIALAAVDAFWAGLEDVEQCRHLLLDTHQRYRMVQQRFGEDVFDATIRCFKGHRTAQLTLAACWARLCAEETRRWRDSTQQREEQGQLRISPEDQAPQVDADLLSKMPWLAKAQQQGTLQLVSSCIQSAANATPPWSTDRCVALARALVSMSSLQSLYRGAAIMQQTVETNLQAATKLLSQLHVVTQDESLQATLLDVTLMCVEDSLMGLSSSSPSQENWVEVQELLKVMIDRLKDLPAVTLPRRDPSSYNSVGLRPLSIAHPRECILALILRTSKNGEVTRHFVQHALPLIPAWFWEHIIRVLQATGKADFEAIRAYAEAIDVYKNELLSISDWESDGTPTGAAQAGVKAVLEALCALALKFTEQLKYLPEPKRQPSKTQFGRTTDARLKSLLTKTAESSSSSTLQSIEALVKCHKELQKIAGWGLVLAATLPSWCQDFQHRMALRTCLRQIRKHTMYSALAADLQTCFFPMEQVEEAEKSEAAAQSAANELMQQEDAEAAKAAAKKAKKLKQKAKKQQAQQQLAPASSAADSSPKSDDEAEPHEDRVDDAFQRLEVSNQTESASDVPDGVGSRMPQGLNGAAPGAEAAAAQGLNGAAPGAGAVEAQGPNGAAPELAVDDSFLQGLFSCPITKVAMKEPVIAADGHTYEKAAILDWLDKHTVSPVTGDFLIHTRVVPNVLVKNLINDTQQ